MSCPSHSGGEGEAVAGSIRFHELLVAQAPEYLRRFGAQMPLRQREVLQKIVRCRTPALGGQLFRCPCCRGYHLGYHSCNDRHCPLCGQTDAEQWLETKRRRLLLPVRYFLVTFTVPEPLRRWMRSHPALAYALLFEASAQALQELGRNLKRLGAQLALLGVLHTWSRILVYHPHIHYLVPAGGLSWDQRHWVHPKYPQYLLNEFALGDRCRTLFREKLQKRAPELIAQIPAKVWKQRWVADCRPAGSGENALRYLSRYVFKTATGNRPLQILREGRVRWPYRDSRTGAPAHVDLEPLELVRRFLEHVLPKQFSRVRWFGWFHPAARARLNRVRALLGQSPVLTEEEQKVWLDDATPNPAEEATLEQPATLYAPRCPRCGQAMQLLARWRAGAQPPSLTSLRRLADPRAPP